MTAPVILIVEDDQAHLESVARICAREGLAARRADSGEKALELLRHEPVDLVLTDLAMPGMSGVELLRAARTLCPETEVVLMTAYGTVEAAVLAMKEGAYDFLTKPFKRHALLKTVEKALEKRRLVAENRALRARLTQLSGGAIVGQSAAFRATMDVIRQAAPSQATVLLCGESGTGKELFARALHDLSPRAALPFVPINCAAIPEAILESELFGYERGAFTGAAARKEGRIERAQGGTLFLDEVAEMSPQVQAKLLRFIQEGEIERLGGTAPIAVDCRVVAATNRDLAVEIQEKRFREDLFYRLNVIGVQLPPLRAREGDAVLLADHFRERFAAKNGRQVTAFSKEALLAIERYAWPGNVRELEHAVERAVVLCRGEQIEVDDLPEKVRAGAPGPGRGEERTIAIRIGTPMDEIEERVIAETLRHTKGDKGLAAQLLGISARTIYRKLAAQEGQSQGGGGED